MTHGNNPSEAVETLAGNLAGGVLILCDHASNALPDGYGTLGLPREELNRHIAYDIGAAGVVAGLSKRLNAPAILTSFSRLLIDCNRGADDPTLIMRLSDGAIVPGNRRLDDAERQHRITTFYEPYHGAISCHIDGAIDIGHPPVLISIHSYTPVWRGQPRPWHTGILWDKDPRLATQLLTELRADPTIVTGANEPYSGRLYGDCMYQHGTSRGLAHAIIEIRQDLIEDASGQTEWANRLARIMTSLLDDPALKADLTSIQYYGSHTSPGSTKGS